ncbi:MAG: tetratricopeptide repeat protein [Actinobacteria bacterium]|nr:tetratricopeptide repeat protein [Actinomycetota bacterium]
MQTCHRSLNVLLCSALLLASWGLAAADAMPSDALPANAMPGRSECPLSAFLPSRTKQPSELRADLERLRTLTQACEERYDFYAQLGALLLELQRFQEAVVALEKALLINPELAGAQLDYAQALAALGRSGEAIDLLNQVANRPDIEESLKVWLRGEIELAAQRQSSFLAQRESAPNAEAAPPSLMMGARRAVELSGALQSGIGRESNLKGSSHVRELTLFLVNGPVLVPLNESQYPVAGLTQRSLVALQANARVGVSELQLGGVVQTRRALNEPIPSQQFSRLEVQFAYPIRSHRVYFGVSQQDLEQGSLYAAKEQKYAITYLFDKHRSGCQPQLGLARAELRYPLTPVMDGIHSVLRAEASCSLLGELRLGTSFGFDDPKRQERPGGSRRSGDLYIRHLAPIQATPSQESVKAITWLRAARSLERSIFSELLIQSPADTRRLDAGFGVSWPFRKHWELNAEFESNSQQSTNPLLNLKNRSVYLVLRWQFASR